MLTPEQSTEFQARLDAFDAIEVVLDDEGVVVPPEAASSLRMAAVAGVLSGAAHSAAGAAAVEQLHTAAVSQARAMFERFGGETSVSRRRRDFRAFRPTRAI